MQPLMIAVDFDGTCAVYEPGLDLDPVFVDYLEHLHAGGIFWVFNTDRPFFQMEEIALALPPPLRPKALLLRQRDIYLLDNDEYRPALPWNHDATRLHQDLWEKITPHIPDWERAILERFPVLNRFVDDEAFAFMTEPGHTPHLRRHLEEIVSPWPDAQVSGNADWSFVLHSSFSKGKLLAAACECLGVPCRSVVAVGDGFNDITMLDGSVTPMVGCPANADSDVVRAVLSAAGIQASKPCGEGTVEVIRHFLARSA